MAGVATSNWGSTKYEVGATTPCTLTIVSTVSSTRSVGPAIAAYLTTTGLHPIRPFPWCNCLPSVKYFSYDRRSPPRHTSWLCVCMKTKSNSTLTKGVTVLIYAFTSVCTLVPVLAECTLAFSKFISIRTQRLLLSSGSNSSSSGGLYRSFLLSRGPRCISLLVGVGMADP